MRTKRLFWLIIILSLLGICIDLPKFFEQEINFLGYRQKISFHRPDINLTFGPLKITKKLELRKGLDLAGGVHLAFDAKTEQTPPESRNEALASLEENIRRRVDIYGLGEISIRTIKSVSEVRLIVEIPGEIDPQQAISLIGQTAQLVFRLEKELPPEATESATIYDFYSQETGLTGAYLKRALVDFDKNTGKPQIAVTFNEEGSKRFAEITKNNVGKRLAIFLDQFLLMAPQIKEPILNGNAVISGDFDLKTVKQIVSQLNAGALPIPLQLVEQSRISPTLGESSLKKGFFAGLIGVGIEAVFMILIYKWLGFLAILGLIVYGIWTLALYKLIPVTLTMPGVAGFLLSLGMAVDSNILIFERMKEEIRSGKPWRTAMELGFGRAWDSIRDANICTLITCFVLLNPLDWPFLNTAGMVRGFAITLGLGVILELFTSIVVVRTIMRVLYRRKD